MFSDFLSGLLKLDPAERWTPWQALRHPFLTGAEFDGPYVPDPDPMNVILSSDLKFLGVRSANADESVARSLPIPGRRESAPSNPYSTDFSLSASQNLYLFRSPYGSGDPSNFSFRQEHTSLPAAGSVPRSDPRSIPIPSEQKSEFSGHRTAYSSGDIDPTMPFSFSGSFTNTPQLSYHSPYTYGLELTRTTNLPADYSWADPSLLLSNLSFPKDDVSLQMEPNQAIPNSNAMARGFGINMRMGSNSSNSNRLAPANTWNGRLPLSDQKSEFEQFPQ
jgi:hypothetical protein